MKQKLQALENAKYERAMAVWNKEHEDVLDQEIERREADGTVDQELINEYVFNCNRLSWINVDRFYKNQMENTRDILAYDEDKEDKQVYLIFPEMNSLMAMTKLATGNYVRKRIPANVSGEVFAFKLEDGKPSVAISSVSGSRSNINLDFASCSFVALRGYLDRYNNS